MNFCPKCGNSIGANDKFCPVCGEKLQNDQPGEVEVKPVSSNEPHQYQYQASGVDTREDKKKKDNGTISLVCGILALGSIVFSWIPFAGIIGLVLSIVSIVFGNKAKGYSYGKTGNSWNYSLSTSNRWVCYRHSGILFDCCRCYYKWWILHLH